MRVYIDAVSLQRAQRLGSWAPTAHILVGCGEQQGGEHGRQAKHPQKTLRDICYEAVKRAQVHADSEDWDVLRSVMLYHGDKDNVAAGLGSEVDSCKGESERAAKRLESCRETRREAVEAERAAEKELEEKKRELKELEVKLAGSTVAARNAPLEAGPMMYKKDLTALSESGLCQLSELDEAKAYITKVVSAVMNVVQCARRQADAHDAVKREQIEKDKPKEKEKVKQKRELKGSSSDPAPATPPEQTRQRRLRENKYSGDSRPSSFSVASCVGVFVNPHSPMWTRG